MSRTVNTIRLGDARAEADHGMLDRAFVETPDYKTLAATAEKCVVVGRRGTGKSALVYRLSKFWSADDRTELVQIAPEEDQVIALRPVMSQIAAKFAHLRAASRIAWRYAILMEIARQLQPNSRARLGETSLSDHLKNWTGYGGVSGRIRLKLASILTGFSKPEVIGRLANDLGVDIIENELQQALARTKRSIVVLIDKLDEGFEPDELGVAMVDGLVQAAIDLNTRMADVRVYVFLRDNIFRAIAQLDPDYSRNIEGRVLRLHWDEFQLLNLVANRLRAAFRLDIEQDNKVWSRCTAKELQGRDGFRTCLQLTLYRPRDILVLLNEAFFQAQRQGRAEIVPDDVRLTARNISQARFQDLHKEYDVIFPGLREFTSRFANGSPELNVADANRITSEILKDGGDDVRVRQHFAIIESPEQALRALYSVGFVGLHDKTSNTYIFSHDGKTPTKEFSATDSVLIHPCYWMALNLSRNTLEPDEAEEIFDEYDIEVMSATPALRAQTVGRLMAELDKIPEGQEGQSSFEDWCLRAVRMLWAGHLSNVALHPNRAATQRRDVVATNLSEKGAWKRILNDYGTRQVIFEVKNFRDLGPNEYRQMLSYLTGDYGRVGFIITRDSMVDLAKGKELDWVRELYAHDHKVLIVKLTGRWLSKLLSKIRSPQKHDEADLRLNTLLDTYLRLYIVGQPSIKGASARR